MWRALSRSAAAWSAAAPPPRHHAGQLRRASSSSSSAAASANARPADANAARLLAQPDPFVSPAPFSHAQKHKGGWARRGRGMLRQLDEEHQGKRLRRAKFALQDYRPGDVLRVTYRPSLTGGGSTSFQGMCIGRYNRGAMRSVMLRNVVEGVPVEMRFQLLRCCCCSCCCCCCCSC